MVTQTTIEKADKETTFPSGISNYTRRRRLVQLRVVSVSTPKEILLGTLGDGRLKIDLPIKVLFAESEGNFIAEAIEFDEFGVGCNYTEALTDLQHTIVELFLTLEKDKKRLGKDLQLLRKKMSEFISLNIP